MAPEAGKAPLAFASSSPEYGTLLPVLSRIHVPPEVRSSKNTGRLESESIHTCSSLTSGSRLKCRRTLAFVLRKPADKFVGNIIGSNAYGNPDGFSSRR